MSSFLKKPYTPVAFTSAVKSFNVYGKSFARTEAVYLSGAPYTNQTFYNPFSAQPKLSAQYPGFFGVKLLSSQYSTNFNNTITFTMPSAAKTGYVDIIVQNPAGYGKLTQYVVKNIYAGEQTQLDLRPWTLGIKVLSSTTIPTPTIPANQIFTISGDILVTISGDNIVKI